jgi:hypothetical protein
VRLRLLQIDCASAVTKGTLVYRSGNNPREKFFFEIMREHKACKKNTPEGWHSIRVQYEPIPPAEKAARGELYLQAVLVHEHRDATGSINAETTRLGRIDVDDIDSAERRQGFYAVADEALDRLQLGQETRAQIAAELALVVRPPSEDIPSRPRIGLGALLPCDK